MFKKTYIKTAAIILAISTLLFLTNCGSQSGSDGDNVPVSIRFNVPSLKMKPLNAPAPSIVKSVTISISAPDITTITDTFDVSAGETVRKTYLIPPGTERTFTIYTYDGTSASGFLLYDGTSIKDLTAGTPITVPITMAEAPYLGKYVSVSRGFDNISAGTPINPYKTITFALDQSLGNEPITVAAGFYNLSSGETFPLTLNPGTELICHGANHSTVIDREYIYSPAIQGAAGSTITGCKIINAGPAVDDVGSQITVSNNWIENFCDALHIGANSTISNNTIQFADTTGDCSQDGITISAAFAPVTPVISNNKITRNNTAINLSLNANPTISGNTITDNWTGVNISSTSRAWINNNVLSCNTGIDLATFSNYSIDATSNQWDNSPPDVLLATCNYGGEDICNNGGGVVDYTGFSLAPSACP